MIEAARMRAIGLGSVLRPGLGAGWGYGRAGFGLRYRGRDSQPECDRDSRKEYAGESRASYFQRSGALHSIRRPGAVEVISLHLNINGQQYFQGSFSYIYRITAKEAGTYEIAGIEVTMEGAEVCGGAGDSHGAGSPGDIPAEACYRGCVYRRSHPDRTAIRSSIRSPFRPGHLLCGGRQSLSSRR